MFVYHDPISRWAGSPTSFWDTADRSSSAESSSRRGIFCSRSAGWRPFISALVLIFIGNGFFKPNISTMVGNFYPAGSPLRDAAYNIFYMGINIGAFLAPIVSEVLAAEDSDSAAAFFSAGLGHGCSGPSCSAFFYRYLIHGERKKPVDDATAARVWPRTSCPTPEKTAVENVPEWKRDLPHSWSFSRS